MSAPPRVVNQRRATITALPLYYSGPLLKKYTGEKNFKTFYGELRGSSLFLYTDEAQSTYAEKLDLQMLKSMDLESPYLKKAPTIFTLFLQNEEVQLKMDNPDTGEEWRGFIMTVATREIPKKLQLLPGQRLRLEEVLAQEKHRQASPLPQKGPFLSSSSASTSSDTYNDGISRTPTCFFPVSRQEAEQMLEDNPSYGSIILRPSTTANNYAVTLRQVYPSGPVMKNYKIRSVDSDLIIELDNPVTVPSLQEVVDYFVRKTEHSLRPYLQPLLYDTHIELPPAVPALPSTGSKIIPKARVAPMIPTGKPSVASPPVSPPAPASARPEVTENEYVVPDDKIKSGLRVSYSKDYFDSGPFKMDAELKAVLQKRREELYKVP